MKTKTNNAQITKNTPYMCIFSDLCIVLAFIIFQIYIYFSVSFFYNCLVLQYVTAIFP